MEELLEIYDGRKEEIRERLGEFRDNADMEDRELFKELCFCLCVPQSRAKLCWEAVEDLDESGLIMDGDSGEMAKVLKGRVRFHNQKADRIASARRLFTAEGRLRVKERLTGFSDPLEMREWLVENVHGMGYKLAGQFMRNTGFHQDFAILDVHILRNMERYGIAKRPKTLTRKRYLELEKMFQEFADKLGLSPAELDLLFWSMETGEVFK